MTRSALVALGPAVEPIVGTLRRSHRQGVPAHVTGFIGSDQSWTEATAEEVKRLAGTIDAFPATLGRWPERDCADSALVPLRPTGSRQSEKVRAR